MGTKQMEKDLRLEYGMDEETSDIEESDYDDLIEEVKVDDDIEELRKEVDNSMNLAEKMAEVNQSVSDYILKCQDGGKSEFVDEAPEFVEDGIEERQLPDKSEDELNVDDEETDDVGNLRDFNSQFKPFRDNLGVKLDDADTRSVRSVSTTASTIHPDVVKARVKDSLEKSKKKNQARRTIAKGEASAKTRSKRENKDVINTSRSAFWA